MQLEGANGIKVDVVIEHARVPPFNMCNQNIRQAGMPWGMHEEGKGILKPDDFRKGNFDSMA